MTDREKLLALLTEWGVGWEPGAADGNEPNNVLLYQGRPKVGGYTGFLAAFEFTDTDAGAFQQISVWE